MMTPNQAIRNGNLRHRQSIANQRKQASTPAEQAQAAAAVIRKRLADGQPLPDLHSYGIGDDCWSQLCAMLEDDELLAVQLACGDVSEDVAPMAAAAAPVWWPQQPDAP